MTNDKEPNDKGMTKAKGVEAISQIPDGVSRVFWPAASLVVFPRPPIKFPKQVMRFHAWESQSQITAELASQAPQLDSRTGTFASRKADSIVAPGIQPKSLTIRSSRIYEMTSDDKGTTNGQKRLWKRGILTEDNKENEGRGNGEAITK